MLSRTGCFAIFAGISTASACGCRSLNPSAPLRTVPHARLYVSRLTTADGISASRALATHYDLIAKQRYAEAWNLYSAYTRHEVPETRFVQRSRLSRVRFVRVLRCRDVKVVRYTGQYVIVRFLLDTIITPAEAALLRSHGHPLARPGGYTFHEERALDKEDGHWRIVRVPAANKRSSTAGVSTIADAVTIAS